MNFRDINVRELIMKSSRRIAAVLSVVALFFLSGPHDAVAKSQPAHQSQESSQKLTKVKHLRAELQSGGVLLKWRPVAGCDGYRIYHARGKKVRWDSAWVDVDSQQASYLFTEVTTGESYSFQVSALRGDKEGKASAQVTVKITGEISNVRSDTAK
jgi:hypothetical protein